MRLFELGQETQKLLAQWGDREVVLQVGLNHHHIKGIEVLLEDPTIVLVILPDMKKKMLVIEEDDDLPCMHGGVICPDDCECMCDDCYDGDNRPDFVWDGEEIGG